MMAYDGFRWEGAFASDWRWPAGGVVVYLLVTQPMFVERNNNLIICFCLFIRTNPDLTYLARQNQRLKLKRIEKALSFSQVIFALGILMKDLKAFQLQKVAVFHNLLLSIGSFVMFLGTSLELLRRWSSSGHFDWFFCEDATTSDGALYFWSYVYYLSKYYETRWCFQILICNPIFGVQKLNKHSFQHLFNLFQQNFQVLVLGIYLV